MGIKLPDDVLAMIRERVASGRYANPEAVMREALRALDGEEELKRAWDEGVASGDWQELDPEAIKREGRATLKRPA